MNRYQWQIDTHGGRALLFTNFNFFDIFVQDDVMLNIAGQGIFINRYCAQARTQGLGGGLNPPQFFFCVFWRKPPPPPQKKKKKKKNCANGWPKKPDLPGQALNFNIFRARPLFCGAHSYITGTNRKNWKGHKIGNLQCQWERHWGQSKGHPRPWPWINLSLYPPPPPTDRNSNRPNFWDKKKIKKVLLPPFNPPAYSATLRVVVNFFIKSWTKKNVLLSPPPPFSCNQSCKVAPESV